MKETWINKRQAALVTIAIIAVLLVLLRHLVLSFVVPPVPPPEPVVDEELVQQLEEITQVEEENTIPFTGSFCQNLNPGAPNRIAESKLLDPYQFLFIAAGVSESVESARFQFQPILDDPDLPSLPHYLALTKLAWMGLRVGDQVTVSDSLERLETISLDGIRPCFQADVAYIRALANQPVEPGQSTIDLLKQAITMNPLHVPAHTQLISARLNQLDNPQEGGAAFSDIVDSMTLLRKVSSARVFAVQLSGNFTTNSCQSANCYFIQGLLYNWSNATEAARQSLANFNAICAQGICQPELVLVANNLQKELQEE